MSEDIPSISSIVSRLPQKIQNRFESLGGYIRGIIDEESNKSGVNIALSSNDVQSIQFAALIYSLDHFFRAGSSSARTAAMTFEQLGLQGFQVGSSHFTKDNDNTRRGDMLADKLRDSIGNSHMGIVIRNSISMRDLISTMIREVNNGQSLDTER